MSDSETVETLKALVRVGFGNGKFDEAEELLAHAMVEQDRDAELWVLRGSALHSLGRFFESWLCYDIAIGLDQSSSDAWIGRGDLMTDLLLLEEALRSYDRSVEITSGGTIALERRAIALQNLGSIPEALACFDRAIATDPAMDELRLERADCLLVARRFAEAITAYEGLAGSSNPAIARQATAMAGRARTHSGQGLLGKVQRLFGIKMADHQWRRQRVDVLVPSSRVEASLRAGSSIFITMVHELVETGKIVDPGEKLDAEQRYRPDVIGRVADEIVIPFMRRAREGAEPTPAERRIHETSSADAWREEYFRWIFTATDMAGSAESQLARARAHLVYWNLETRYPELAGEIYSIRGREPFASGRIAQAIENERPKLVELTNQRTSDPGAFKLAVRMWLGQAK